MEIPSFLVSLQRLAARAVVNDFLVSNVFGPNPNDPQQTYSGHLGYAVTLVGEFEKLVQSGAIKPLAAINTSPNEIAPSSFTNNNKDAAENEELDTSFSSGKSIELRQVASDIGNYAVLSSALPPLIVSAASDNLSLTHPEFETGHEIPSIFKKFMASPPIGGLVSADAGTTPATATESTLPLVATTFDESSAAEAAKFLYHCTAVFYGFFNEEVPPLPLEVFTRVFIAALKTVANNNKNAAAAMPTPLIAGGAANSKTTTAVAVVPEKKTSSSPSTSVAATLSFQAQLSSYLKTAQIQLQKASDNAQGEEDPDIEIRFFHLAAIVDLILRHFPSDLYISNCCIPIGDSAIQRSGDAELIRIIGGSRRRRRRTARQRNANDNKTASSDKNNGEGDDNSNISGGGPLIAASARAKTAREIFAEEQARKAGVHIEEDNENGDDDHLIGPLGRPKRQATYDEAKTEAFEIEVNDTIPAFLKDVARKTYINYRRAPINLAEKREQEAQMAARKAVVAAAREGALSSSAAAAAKAATLLSIAENQEKKNMERRRIRAIERKRQETEAAAAAATYKSQSFDDEEGGGGNDYERAGRIVVQEVAGDGKVGQKVIFEPKLTEGELEVNDLEVGGGVRSERDINSLPPWLRAAATGSDGRVHFGYQTNKSMEEQRKSLPVYKSREKIVEYVKNHSVTILQGETGSGKTTQIPQYLCDAGLTKRDPSDPYFTNNNNGSGYGSGMRQREELMIGITQPRRVAAIELAKRVAKERGTRCGDEVGYTVRFDDQTSDRTKIKYMTDGMLLREALLDDTFSRYSIIVLDEAHERSINTDVLFGVLKKAVAKRPSLKLVITSATIELDRFCQYFGVSERFEIEGRTYPVDIKYLDTPCDDYVEKAVNTALTIHLTDKDLKGDILIFLTGEDEINSAIDRIQSRFTSLRDKAKRELPPERHPFDLLVLPCYATVPNEAMSKVFDKTPARTRKIVISTNVAETSITIDGLAFVIDSGFCKQHVYDPRNKVEELKIVPVSQAQATQRTGRAGRTNPGACYRLFTQDQFENEMLPATVPEIQRTNLINIVLTLKAVGFDDLLEFDFLDPPPKETLVNALQTLRYLGALDDDGLLTPIGERMSALPLPPAESKTLLASIDFGCAPTVMTIVSMMGQRKVFFTPGDRREEADFAHRQLKHPDGDQLTLANVYNSWVESGMSEKWCKANFVNPRAVTEARRAREQLQQMLSQRHDITKDARDSVAIRKALTSGYFFQAAKRGENNMYVTMADRRAVAMHPTSALFEQTPQYVVYHQLALKKKEYMMEVMRIEPQWLVELAPAYYAKPRAGELTKEQKAMRVDPILRPWDSKNSWRISKVRKQKQ